MAAFIIAATLVFAALVAACAVLWSLAAAARGLGDPDDGMAARRENRKIIDLIKQGRSGK